ncbi:MAG: hypothetical protein FJ358_03725 [Thaumarchaeota archaeon]|nr:hypothetical protein [Nitrososphaerota archaeon]
MTTVELDSETLAKYPFMQEAGDYIGRLEFDISELTKSENAKIVQRAKERILEAIKKAKISKEITNIEIEILSFPLALAFVKATGLELLMSRYAFAEAVRVESFLESEKIPIITLIFQRVTGTSPEVLSGNSFEFRIPVIEYLKRATYFHTPEWKLVNRVVENGNIYIRKSELIRLIREEIKNLIHNKLHMLSSFKIPHEFQSIVEELVRSSPTPTNTTEKITITPDKYPPCLVKALDLLQTGQNIPHYGRFLMTTFLLSVGKNVNDIVQLYPKVPDFNEKITRYQVEHIAGLRGGRTRYKVPSCRTLATHNFCFRTQSCGTIMNPLQFASQKPQEKKVKKKVARKDTNTS